MLDVEQIVEQYKAKGGTDDRIVYEILTQCSEEIKNWMASMISQYSDLSKLNFSTLVDIRHDKNINMEILDKYVRACLEDRDNIMAIFDEYLESKHKIGTAKTEKTITLNNRTKNSSNGITCKMFPGSTDVETSVLVNGLFEAAVEWYGKEYEQRLRDTIDGTLFYECGEDESCIDVEEKFSGVKHSKEEKQKLIGVVGMTIKLDNENGDYQPVEVYKKNPYFDYTATLAHELFYHQFCRQSNFEVQNDEGKKFYRDGISLLPQHGGLKENEALNEGFADYNATGIMRIYTGNPKYRLDPRRLYEPLQKYAEQIATCYDKQQLMDMITTGKPSIEELTQIEKFDFSTFSGYLDMYLRTQDIQYIKIADMFFQPFREKHNLIQNQMATTRSTFDNGKMNFRAEEQRYPQYGTTGRRPKKNFVIGGNSYKLKAMMPTPENIDDLEEALRMLDDLIRSMSKDGRNIDD